MLHIVTRLFYRFSCITIAVLLLFLSLHRTIYHRKVLIWCRAETRPFLLLLPSKEYIIMSIQSLTDQFAQALELVDSVATRAYSQNLSRMVNAVNETMQQHPQLPDLIGPNPIQVMEEHRNNLARLMLAQFRFNGARTLVGGLIWMDRTLIESGFSPDYFLVELDVWMQTIDQHLDARSARPIKQVYQLMRDVHPQILVLAQQSESEPPPNNTMR